jgi:hypothetical protein|tara:strand:- start:19 stop:468 length:450 start_codon:yes stop_codon:yes gene_type:complete
MADQKISELPLNSSINGTENVATERGGSNYKSSLQDIKDFVLENVPSSGVQTVTGVNVDNTDPENPVINQDDTKANQSDLTIVEGQTVILQAENIAQQLELNSLQSDKLNSVTTGEPTGSDKVLNMVSLTQAEYDAGTPIATTFYIITP